MRVEVDTARCTSIGMCESVAPDVFEVDDDGALQLLAPEQPEERRALLEEAVASCPTGALRLVG